MTANFEMVRHASVDVETSYDSKGKPVLELIVNDKYKHQFPASSKFSKAVENTPISDIQSRLNGGHYFFVGDSLIDFRDNSYRGGFIHEDDAISNLMQHIGVYEKSHKQLRNNGWGVNSSLTLGRQWSNQEIIAKNMNDGGVFDGTLSYLWSPFSDKISTLFQIVRQLCSNGMTATTDILNTKIPLMNRWDEHLHIASAQIHAKANSLVSNRMHQMMLEHASVNDLMLIAKHIHTRLGNEELDVETKRKLTAMYKAVNPVFHLNKVYKDSVFNNTSIASHTPAHLSKFDAYNALTELSSHYSEHGASTFVSLNKKANELVFEEDRKVQHKLGTSNVSAFSDPDMAFFAAVA